MYSRMELTAWVTVLIDTWWNVNSIAFTFAFLKPKF